MKKVKIIALGVALFGIESLGMAVDTWVAVGYGGRRMISSDGVKWEITAEWAEKGGDDSNNLMGLTHGLGKTTLASVDGKSWQISPIKPQGKPLWTDGTRFISSSWPGNMSFSPDGKQWIKANELTPNGINKVVKAE